MVHLVIYRAMDSIMVAGINIDMLDCPKVTYIYSYQLQAGCRNHHIIYWDNGDFFLVYI
jgi:hypothetical protein